MRTLPYFNFIQEVIYVRNIKVYSLVIARSKGYWLDIIDYYHNGVFYRKFMSMEPSQNKRIILNKPISGYQNIQQ